jgi:hypothetical protein
MTINNGYNEDMQKLFSTALSMLNEAIADNDKFAEQLAITHYKHVLLINHKGTADTLRREGFFNEYLDVVINGEVKL